MQGAAVDPGGGVAAPRKDGRSLLEGGEPVSGAQEQSAARARAHGTGVEPPPAGKDAEIGRPQVGGIHLPAQAVLRQSRVRPLFPSPRGLVEVHAQPALRRVDVHVGAGDVVEAGAPVHVQDPGLGEHRPRPREVVGPGHAQVVPSVVGEVEVVAPQGPRDPRGHADQGRSVDVGSAPALQARETGVDDGLGGEALGPEVGQRRRAPGSCRWLPRSSPSPPAAAIGRLSGRGPLS